MRGLVLILTLALSVAFSEDLFKLKWKKYVGERNYAVQNNSLIFGKYVLHTSYNKLYVFDKDGKLLWSFEGTLGMNGFAVTPDFIAVGDAKGYLYALSWDGKLLWKFEAGGLISNVSAGDINGDGEIEVLVGSGDNHIYALSGKDGRLLWKFKTGGSIYSSPALGDLDGNGYIDMAVASWDGYLYVFEATARGGEVVWSTFHGDASRTGLYQNAVSFAKANLSGNAFAWYPHSRLFFELARKGVYKYFSFHKVTYKLTSYPKINQVKKKKALNTGIKVAKAELKRKLAKEVKRMVEKNSKRS